MKTYEIKRYDNFQDYDDDQCTPVVITEKQMSFYLLRVHCDTFTTALEQFCESFAKENVDWKPIFTYIIDNHRHSNHITDHYWVGKTESYSYFLTWRENGLCEVSIILYRRNIPTDEVEETETNMNAKTKDVNSQDFNRVYCPVFGGWMMRYDACQGGCDYDSETDTCKLSRNNTRVGGDA